MVTGHTMWWDDFPLELGFESYIYVQYIEGETAVLLVEEVAVVFEVVAVSSSSLAGGVKWRGVNV